MGFVGWDVDGVGGWRRAQGRTEAEIERVSDVARAPPPLCPPSHTARALTHTHIHTRVHTHTHDDTPTSTP